MKKTTTFLICTALIVCLFSDSFLVAVQAKKVLLSQKNISITVGQTAKVTLKNVKKKVKWKVTKGKKCISIKATGKKKNKLKISGLKKGTSKIKATYKGKKYTITVKVNPKQKLPKEPETSTVEVTSTIEPTSVEETTSIEETTVDLSDKLPYVPTNLYYYYQTGDETTYSLDWNEAFRATSYNVYINGKFYASTTERKIELGVLAAGDYTFGVSAVNEYGESEKATYSLTVYVEDPIYSGYFEDTKTAVISSNPKDVEGSFYENRDILGGSDTYVNQRATTLKILGEVQPVNMDRWFSGHSTLQKIEGLENLDTSKVKNFSKLFYGCSSLTSLDISNFNIVKCEDLSSMFNGCTHLSSLKLPASSTENVTDMSCMFMDCSSLKSLDLTDFNTCNVSTLSSMFEGCQTLTSLNLVNFNTLNVKDFSRMFYNCKNLKTLNISSFKSDNATTIENMFSLCKKLEAVDLPLFKGEKIENMYQLFYECEQLKTVNLPKFTGNNCTTMECAFQLCSSLESLDLSSFNTAKVQNMNQCFESCSSLQTITYGQNFVNTALTSSHNMFFDCPANRPTWFVEEN